MGPDPMDHDTRALARVIVDESAAGRFEANTVTGSRGAGIWVDDEGTAPRFSGNHVNGSAVGTLVTDGAGGDYRSNDLRGNTRGSWHLDSPGRWPARTPWRMPGCPEPTCPTCRRPGGSGPATPPSRLN